MKNNNHLSTKMIDGRPWEVKFLLGLEYRVGIDYRSSVIKTGYWIKTSAEDNECTWKKFSEVFLNVEGIAWKQSLPVLNRGNQMNLPLWVLYNFLGFLCNPHTTDASFQWTAIFWMTYSNKFQGYQSLCHQHNWFWKLQILKGFLCQYWNLGWLLSDLGNIF